MPDHDIFTTDIQTRFRDLDAMGHVNNAVFFTFFEHGRIMFIESAPQRSKFPDLSFILAAIRCDYLKQVTLTDKLTLRMWVKNIGTKSFGFVYQLVDRDDPATVFATAESVQVRFDYPGNRSVPLSPEIRQGLEAYLEK